MSDPGTHTQDGSAGVIRVLLIEDDRDDYVLTRDFLAETEGSRFQLDWVRTFEEGRAAYYQAAKYGELRVSPSGEALLSALRDADRNPL